MTNRKSEIEDQEPDEGFVAEMVSIFGYMIGVSYPVLAFSTGVRALYQLFLKEGITNYMPPILSGVAALCYIIASVGFFHRKKWSWRVSLLALVVEMVFALVVGVLSFTTPDMIGRTVWAKFGIDYGFFPFIQPLLGIIWLTWTQTLKEYGLIPKEAMMSWGDALKQAIKN